MHRLITAAILWLVLGTVAAPAQPSPDLVKAAAQEGQVSYWDTIIQPETNDALAAAFRKAYGLPASFKVNYTLSATGALVTRVDQELQANRVTMDVAAVASLPWLLDHVRQGHVMEYASPQYAAFARMFELGLGKKDFFAFNGAYVFVPMWNEDNLSFKGRSWQDVLGAVDKQRLSVGDASKSETYLATFFVLRKTLGDEYFKNLAAMSPNFILRSENVASRLVAGEDLLAFAGMPTRAFQFNERGARLKFVLPQEGVVLLPQATFILKDAPHPAAAKLWIDFILSEEGQKILVEREALMSGRAGFKSPLPDYAPAIDSLKVLPVDWQSVSTEELKQARADWTKLFGQ
jgi:iron(III) transport system substrate-binding protein